jgi:hypothetical protein
LKEASNQRQKPALGPAISILAQFPTSRLQDNDPCCSESMTFFAVRRYAFGFTDHCENPQYEEEQ